MTKQLLSLINEVAQPGTVETFEQYLTVTLANGRRADIWLNDKGGYGYAHAYRGENCIGTDLSAAQLRRLAR